MNASARLVARFSSSLFRAKGTDAPSLPLAALLALAITALLSLTASSASAATPNFCPPGSAAGQCDNPAAVAVDQSTGTVYVGETNNNRVSVFDSSGHFLRAFGFGVSNGEDVLQTCVTLCIRGVEDVGGENEGLSPRSVALDNSAGPSAGDVYVFNRTASSVEKYKLNPLRTYPHREDFDPAPANS